MTDFLPIGLSRNPQGDVSGIHEMKPGELIPSSFLQLPDLVEADASSIQGRAVCNTVPTINQSLVYNGSQWCPSTVTGGGTFSGQADASSLQTFQISTATPGSNNVLAWDGSKWVPSGLTYPSCNCPSSTNASSIMGVSACSSAPTTGQIYVYNGAGWCPSTSVAGNVSGPAVSVAGHVVTFTDTTGKVLSDSGATNTTATWNANKIQSTNVSSTAPTTNQALIYNGAGWVPSTIPTRGGSINSTESFITVVDETGTLPNSRLLISNSGNVRITDGGAGVNISIDAENATAQWNANKLQDNSIDPTAPTDGQVLTWDALDSVWIPASPGTPTGLTSQFLVLANTSNLSAERKFVAGDGLGSSDAGANSSFTVSAIYTSGIWNASGLKGINVTTSTPTNLQILTYTTSAGVSGWVPSTLNIPGQAVYAPSTSQYLTLAADAGLSAERVFTIGGGLSSLDGGANGNYTISAIYSSAIWNASALRGFNVSTNTPTGNQVLGYNSTLSAWVPSSVPAVSSTLLDGLIHTDTAVGVVVAGDLVYGNSTPKWDRLAKGLNTQALKLSAGLPAWGWQQTSTVSSTNGTLTSGIDIFYINVSSTSCTNNIFSPVGLAGKIVEFIKIDNTGQYYQLSGTAWFVNNTNTSAIYLNYPLEKLSFISDGTNWILNNRSNPFTHSNHPDFVYIVDDFNVGSLEDGEVGLFGWGFDTNGSIATNASVAGHPGIISRTCGTVAGTPAAVYQKETASTAVIKFSEFKEIKCVCNVAATVTDVEYRVGLSSDWSTSAATNGVYFEKLAADSTWFIITRLAGTQTRTDSTISASSNAIWQTLRIFNRDGTTIEFYINNQLVGTSATNIPLGTTGLAAGFHINPTSTNGRKLNVDLFSILTFNTTERY